MASKRQNIFQGLTSQRGPKRRKIEVTKKYLTTFSIESYNSVVKLCESRSQLRKVPCARAKISKYHILETENTGKDIFNKIMSMNIGLTKCDRVIEKNINFAKIIPVISPILEKFKKKHKMFKYRDELKYILNKAKKKSAKQKYKGQVRIYLLKLFFGFVLYKNVPSGLFGSRPNFKAIKKTVHCLLKTRPKKIPIKPPFAINRKMIFKYINGGLLNIEPLLEKFDISKVKWLHPLKDIKQKWFIILKLLHWFFAQYIIKILHKYVVLLPSKHAWLYIVKDDWCQMQHTFISEKINKGDLLLHQPMLKNKVIYNKLYINRLAVSTSGLRVIARCHFGKAFFKIEIVLRFLQQLYVTYFLEKEKEKRLPTVKTCISQINNFKKSTSDPLYYVHCDIQDAFGSIKLKKLHDIIRDCCKINLPICIIMREYKKENNKRKQKKNKTTVQFLDMKHLELRSIGACIAKKPQLVNWFKLISIIKKLLFKNQIQLFGKVYLIKTGVPQGLRLSSIFSEIYYQDMCNKFFSEFQNNGLLCRYVDDVLYVTKEKNYAEQFFKIIRNGIPEYNVKFNPNKIQTNVELPSYKLTKIRFLGNDIFV